MIKNMRYIKIVLVSAFIISLSQISRAQHITGSKHDFSDATAAAWNQAANLPATSSTTKGQIGGQICAPCHAPHTYTVVGSTSTLGGSPTGTPANSPLWSHTMSTATYQTYTGYNMKAVVGQPDGTTKLCLSCHDGTVALSYYRTFPSNGQTSTTTMASINGGASNFGTDLRNDHPVSFVYNAALVSLDPKMYDPTVTNSGLGAGSSTIDADMLDANHEVQCTSCHDPHNNSGAPHMLVKSNTSSALCLTCHNK
jgi:predicted CXXCH cytochrome family protein